MSFRLKRVQCISPSGLHQMSYTEWGAAENPRVLICVHGLTRNGRDFDTLAAAMSAEYRVICPDVVGRGLSSTLRDPNGYGIPQYVADMVSLIARLDVENVDWLGTSMGGLIGMALAAQEASPISRLLLNDVGPLITVDALKRIADYVGREISWPNFEQGLAYVKLISAPFGDLDDAQWQRLTETSIAQREDGRWAFRYDPNIATPFKASFVDQDINLWPLYGLIKCPTLVVRGETSDLLTRETWQQMGEFGPKAALVEIPKVGHAPMFMCPDQIAVAREFFITR